MDVGSVNEISNSLENVLKEHWKKTSQALFKQFYVLLLLLNQKLLQLQPSPDMEGPRWQLSSSKATFVI